MKQYIPAKSIESAKLISKILWEITRPIELRGNLEALDDYYCGWIVCTDNSVWLEIDDADTQPIRSISDETLLDEILEDALIEGRITPEQLNNSKNLIIDSKKKGDLTKANIWQVIPQGIKDNAKTYQELKDMGLIEEIQ
ncbi:MAG: hypothetical protein ACLFQP_12055 [Halothece sp.]